MKITIRTKNRGSRILTLLPLIFCCVMIEGLARADSIVSEKSLRAWFKNRFSQSYRDISAEGKIIEPAANQSLKFALDGNPFTEGILYIPKDHRSATFSYDFGKKKNLGKIRLFFKGDLHRATSYHPTDYQIQIRSNRQWLTVADVKNHRSSSAIHFIPLHLETERIKISFSKAYLDETVLLGEISFSERQGASWRKGILHFLKDYQKSLLASFFYTFLFSLMLFFPGYIIAQRIRFLDGEDKFAASFFFGSILFVIISLAGILTKIYGLFYLVVPISILSLILFFAQKGFSKILKLDRTLLILLPLFLLFSTLYQYHRDAVFALPHVEDYLDKLAIPPMPYFGYHGDNLYPWRIAKVMLHRLNPGSPDMIAYIGDTQFAFFKRTHFLPLLNVPFLYIFGESHFIYQKLLTVLGGLFLVPVYLVAKKMFGPSAAKVTAYGLLLNYFFLFLGLGVETYYKYFAFFPIALVLLIIEKYGITKTPANLLAALAGGVSFFIHPILLPLYLFAIIVYLCLKERKFVTVSKWALLTGFAVLCIAIPWKLCAYHAQIENSSGIVEIDPYLPLALTQGTASLQRRLGQLGEIFAPFGEPSRWLGQGGLVSTLSPVIFLLFIASLVQNPKKIKIFLPLAFVPPILLALLQGQYFGGATLFGCYLAIPLILAQTAQWLLRKKALLPKILSSLFLIIYLAHNLYRGYKFGSFFPSMIDFEHLQPVHIATFSGMALYLIAVSILLAQAVFSSPAQHRSEFY